jgi:HAD superfamily hydrolase (TIGR01509 family)
MDGVLVDSADAHRRAWQELGRETGVCFSDALFARTFGQRNENIIPVWLGEASPARVAKLGDRKEVLYRELVRQGAVLVYPGVGVLFAALRRCGARLAVASSGPRANVDMLMRQLGVTSVVHASLAAEDVKQGKPHPEVFLKAAERLRVPAEQCAVVEDSVHGVEAAKRAGMLAVAVLTTTEHERLLAAGADYAVPAVCDLNADALAEQLQQRP